jgi:hypothetical protein
MVGEQGCEGEGILLSPSHHGSGCLPHPTQTHPPFPAWVSSQPLSVTSQSPGRVRVSRLISLKPWLPQSGPAEQVSNLPLLHHWKPGVHRVKRLVLSTWLAHTGQWTNLDALTSHPSFFYWLLTAAHNAVSPEQGEVALRWLLHEEPGEETQKGTATDPKAGNSSRAGTSGSLRGHA